MNKIILLISCNLFFRDPISCQNTGIGISTPLSKLHIYTGSSGTTPNPGSRLTIEHNDHEYLNFLTPANKENGILFGLSSNGTHGGIIYNNFANPGGMQFRTSNNQNRMVIDQSGNVGIGTNSPLARFHVADSVVLFSGSLSLDSLFLPVTGSIKFLWIPQRGAFRAGYSDVTWNASNIGYYSFASGSNTLASGINATAMGFNSIASGNSSTAIGSNTVANNTYSTALGNRTHAYGLASTALGNESAALGAYSTATGFQTNAIEDYTTAMGNGTEAGGFTSTAMGFQTLASGDYSIAMGNGSRALGIASVAIGFHSGASGDYSTAMGYNALTGGRNFSFCFSGNSSGALPTNSADNQMMMDFPGGYYFWTGPIGQGVHLDPNGNGWLSNSDYRKKENLIPLDGEKVLTAFRNIHFSSWNYKGGNSARERHYGIMAQDFYTAFGRDLYGTIGNDTTVNPIDMIGVDMAAIQALEKRTRSITTLLEENKSLQQEIEDLKKQVEELIILVRKKG